MADFTLKAVSPMDGYSENFDGVSLREVADLDIVSIALPLGGEELALTAIQSVFGISAPPVGTSATTVEQSARLVRLAQDQLFVLIARAKTDAADHIADQFNGAAYTTDQTDGWTGLEIAGTRARDILERICPLDLHPHAFAINSAARTSMEHLGTIIIRTGDETYQLLSASSSAGSFLYAVKTSVLNCLP